jgi:protein SCO1/2
MNPERRSLLALALGLVLPSACRREPELDKLGTLSDFALTDQEGRSYGTAQLRGQPWVASFFFTRCPTICPRLIAALRDLQSSAKKASTPLRIVSFSVDPEHDTPAVLKAYALEAKADLASWTFLTGDAALIQKTAVDGFKLATEGKADAGAEHFGILHGSHLVLVDRALTLRDYYRSEDAEARAKLLADANRLAS